MSDNDRLTLSGLQRLIKERLAENFPEPLWITAEIGELKVNSFSGHCYLELVEKGGDNGVPKARASAVIWHQRYGMISSYFHGATGHDLEAGMKILVCVSVTYHELYGLSLQISDIDPLYTLGDLEQQRQRTILQLREEGVFDMNRELDFPIVPQRLAVVSSPNAAGLRDFMNELAAGGYHLRVTLFESVMQGQEAEESIVSALERIALREKEFDAVAIIRGGGSQSDLSCFNSYLLCCNIAQFPLPIVTGIGHDKDQSVADMVAAIALKTPTAVAAFFIQRLSDFEKRIDTAAEDLTSGTATRFLKEKERLRHISIDLQRCTREFTHNLETRITALQIRLTHRAEQTIHTRIERLKTYRLIMSERVGRNLSTQGQRLEGALRIIENRDPKRLLKAGFAIVRSEGVCIHDATELTVGQNVSIVFARGKAEAKITDNGKEKNRLRRSPSPNRSDSGEIQR